MKKIKGFTLVELLVVISIIAVLLAVLIPSLHKAREIAKRIVCGNQVKQMGVAMSGYIQEYDNRLPFYGGYDSSFPSPFNVTADKSRPQDEGHPYAVFRDDKAPWMRTANRGPIPMKLACLFVRGYLKDAKVFYCPSNQNTLYRYDSYVSPLRPGNNSNEWGTLPQAYNDKAKSNQWVRVGYAYYPIDETLKGASGMDPVGGVLVPKYTARRFDKLDRAKPYLSDVLWQRKDLSHKSGINTADNRVRDAGINALFKDGHVNFAKDTTVTVRINNVDKTQRLFDNTYWSNWDPPRGEVKPDDVDIRYLLYNIYKLVQP